VITYLVDGYNLLYALPDLPAGSWPEKRSALLTLLTDKKPHGRNALVVVFDSREGLGQREQSGDIMVIYTAGETADDWISAKVRTIATPRAVVVVTDDQGIRQMIKGTGAKWQSCLDFLGKGHASRKPATFNDSSHADAITRDLMKKWL
jgi:predicted RNA-binding protein with PIN domain